MKTKRNPGGYNAAGVIDLLQRADADQVTVSECQQCATGAIHISLVIEPKPPTDAERIAALEKEVAELKRERGEWNRWPYLYDWRFHNL